MWEILTLRIFCYTIFHINNFPCNWHKSHDEQYFESIPSLFVSPVTPEKAFDLIQYASVAIVLKIASIGFSVWTVSENYDCWICGQVSHSEKAHKIPRDLQEQSIPTSGSKKEVPTQWKFIYYTIEVCWNNKTLDLTVKQGIYKANGIKSYFQRGNGIQETIKNRFFFKVPPIKVKRKSKCDHINYIRHRWETFLELYPCRKLAKCSPLAPRRSWALRQC